MSFPFFACAFVLLPVVAVCAAAISILIGFAVCVPPPLPIPSRAGVTRFNGCYFAQIGVRPALVAQAYEQTVVSGLKSIILNLLVCC